MGATHYKGPVWSQNGFITGAGLGQPGVHFSGPVVSDNGFAVGNGPGGTHFKGPVYSVAGFEGGVSIVSTHFEATAADALTVVIPSVGGGAGTRLVVFVAWDRDASQPAPPTVTYGATGVPQIGVPSAGAARAVAAYSLAAPAGAEDVTATFVTTATTATVVTYVLNNEGGLGTSEIDVGTGTQSEIAVVVPTGGIALDIIDIDTQTITANSGQQDHVNVSYGTGGDTHQAASSSKFGGSVGWTWSTSSGFVHIAVPVLPA